VKKQNKSQNYLYYSLVASIIIYILQRRLFQANTINKPFFFYYFALGASVVYYIYKKKFKLNYWHEYNNVIIKSSLFLFVFIAYIGTYFLVVISITLFTFGIINFEVAKSSPIEYHTSEIVNFAGGTRRNLPSIQFYFNSKINSFSGSNEIYTLFYKENRTKKSYFVFSCRKALLGSYILNDWHIQLSDN
jgi:hypothetical protein